MYNGGNRGVMAAMAAAGQLAKFGGGGGAALWLAKCAMASAASAYSA